MIFKKTKNKKKAFDMASKEALLVMRNILTGYVMINNNEYINLSNHGAENAPEALMVMQRFDTPRPHRPAGSTPAWGAPLRTLNLMDI